MAFQCFHSHDYEPSLVSTESFPSTSSTSSTSSVSSTLCFLHSAANEPRLVKTCRAETSVRLGTAAAEPAVRRRGYRPMWRHAIGSARRLSDVDRADGATLDSPTDRRVSPDAAEKSHLRVCVFHFTARITSSRRPSRRRALLNAGDRHSGKLAKSRTRERNVILLEIPSVLFDFSQRGRRRAQREHANSTFGSSDPNLSRGHSRRPTRTATMAPPHRLSPPKCLSSDYASNRSSTPSFHCRK